MSDRFGRFIELSGVLPITQFACRKGLGTCEMLLCVPQLPCALQSSLESGKEAGIVHIYFSAVFYGKQAGNIR